MPQTAALSAQQMEKIARQVFQEQAESLRREILEGELGRFRHEFEVQMGRVWEAIHALAEAQQRTEKRVEELAQAQARTEERVTRLVHPGINPSSIRLPGACRHRSIGRALPAPD